MWQLHEQKAALDRAVHRAGRGFGRLLLPSNVSRAVRRSGVGEILSQYTATPSTSIFSTLNAIRTRDAACPRMLGWGNSNCSVLS